MSAKPFPMPGSVWRYHGDACSIPSGPHVVTSLRWQSEAQAVFADSCAGIEHMMRSDTWECVIAASGPGAPPLTEDEVADIRRRHEACKAIVEDNYATTFVIAHADRGALLAEVDRLRAVGPMPKPPLADRLAAIDAAERAYLIASGWKPATEYRRRNFWTDPTNGCPWPRAGAIQIQRDRDTADPPVQALPEQAPIHATLTREESAEVSTADDSYTPSESILERARTAAEDMINKGREMEAEGQRRLSEVARAQIRARAAANRGDIPEEVRPRPTPDKAPLALDDSVEAIRERAAKGWPFGGSEHDAVTLLGVLDRLKDCLLYEDVEATIRADAIAGERAAVVAYLNRQTHGGDWQAAAILRGEHLRPNPRGSEPCSTATADITGRCPEAARCAS